MEGFSRLSGFFWAFSVGIVSLFLFFAAIGGISLLDSLWLTGLMALLLGLFARHSLHVSHDLHESGHEDLMHALHRGRERRGF